jgi:hypothetical protein
MMTVNALTQYGIALRISFYNRGLMLCMDEEKYYGSISRYSRSAVSRSTLRGSLSRYLASYLFNTEYNLVSCLFTIEYT